MRHILYTFLTGSLLLTTTVSCVDLNQEPQSFLTEEEYIEYPKDAESVTKGINALYNQLRGTKLNSSNKEVHDNYGFNARIQAISVSADDITISPSKPNNRLIFLENLTPSISSNDPDFQTLWTLFYKVINNSNKIIEGTPITENDKDKLQKVLGEAYFLRGLSYFYLVRIFGDVPLTLNKDDLQLTMKRSSVSDIYDKAIIPSLKQAVEWLPETSRSGDNSTPSKWAAKACLADAYMTMAGWPLKRENPNYYSLAATELENIIDESGLELENKYEDLWKESLKTKNNEHMFAIHHSVKTSTASNYGYSYYPYDYYPRAGWRDYFANEAFYNNYPNDERKKCNFMTEWEKADGVTIDYKNSLDKLPVIKKYQDYDERKATDNKVNSAQSNGITSIYRYADVLLMYAEASTRATGSVSSKAQEALWDVQRRAQGHPSNPNLTTTTNKDEFLEAVFNENGWEFFAEMRRWFDLVRLEKVSEKRADAWNNSLFKANNHYYFPIPYQQIDLTGWTNNPGY